MKNSPNKNISLLAYIIAALTAINFLFAEDKGSDSKNGKIKVLLIDGQNNHDWVRCSPVMIDTLKATGKFEIDVLPLLKVGLLNLIQTLPSITLSYPIITGIHGPRKQNQILLSTSKREVTWSLFTQPTILSQTGKSTMR